jgi:hypothetical protein
VTYVLIKFLLLAVGAIVVVYFVIARRPGVPGLPKPLPTLAESVQQLLISRSPDAFLIVSVAGTDDFLQLKPTNDGVELDLPQITERQREVRNAFERVCEHLDLPLTINHGTDGSEFLDVEIRGPESEIIPVIRRFLTEVFGFADTQELSLELNE